MKALFSQRASAVQSTALSDLLKVTEDPSIISFAGGLPAPASFPVEEMRAAFNRLMTLDPYFALQYSATAGLPALRQWIADYKSPMLGPIDPEQVLIVSGSQQGFDLIGKLFINPGEGVIVENPTYLGAIQSFDLCQPSYHSVATDREGIQIETIANEVAKRSKLMYIQPNFNNPTGKMTSNARRDDIADFITRNKNMILIEDDPYGELWFENEPPKPIFGRCERVIYMGTFSKILSPGLRLGYLIADKEIISALTGLKQATDLHTSSLTQQLAVETLTHFSLAAHLAKIRDYYKNKANVMNACLHRMIHQTNVSWNQPQGGMFIWMNLPATMNAEKILKQAMQQKVAFVPGEVFYASEKESNHLRLSFATVSEQNIAKGVSILASLLNE